MADSADEKRAYLENHQRFMETHPEAKAYCIHNVKGKFCGNDITKTGLCQAHGMDTNHER